MLRRTVITCAAAILALPAAASAQTGWYAGGPLPAGNEFTGVRATSATAVQAFGKRGALALSADGGQSWSPASAPSSADLVDIAFPTGLTGYAVDSEGSLFKTVDGGNGWTKLGVNLGSGLEPGNQIVVVDPNTVIAHPPSGPAIIRSTDGGASFKPVLSRNALRGFPLERADRAGGNVIFLWGSDEQAEAWVLWTSRNAGATFTEVDVPENAFLDDLDMASARRGYLTDSGTLQTTRNGGRAWGENFAVGTHGLGDPVFSDPANGWLLYGSAQPPWRPAGTYVLRTSDGGKSFRPQRISEGPSLLGFAAPVAKAGFALTPNLVRGAPAGPGVLFGTSTGGDRGTPTSLSIKAKPGKKNGRTRKVTISGRLRPGRGGDKVYVAHRTTKFAADWNGELVTVTAGGTFTRKITISRETKIVAQWPGDASRGGDGTTALTVKP